MTDPTWIFCSTWCLFCSIDLRCQEQTALLFQWTLEGCRLLAQWKTWSHVTPPISAVVATRWTSWGLARPHPWTSLRQLQPLSSTACPPGCSKSCFVSWSFTWTSLCLLKPLLLWITYPAGGLIPCWNCVDGCDTNCVCALIQICVCAYIFVCVFLYFCLSFCVLFFFCLLICCP